MLNIELLQFKHSSSASITHCVGGFLHLRLFKSLITDIDRIHKSDIKTKKERCGSARHFNSKCYHDTNPFQYVQVQLIEQIESNSSENVEDVLWDREKNWLCQLFTITKGMNSILDLYSSKRKGCRKR